MKDFVEKISILTPATPEMLSDCRDESEALLIGALSMRGMWAEMIGEVLADYRRIKDHLESGKK